MTERCAYCDRPATRWCDFVIGREKGGEQYKKGTLKSPKQGWYPVVSSESRYFTCDRPLCDECAVDGGISFACGKGGWIDSIDYCRDHEKGRNSSAPIITEDEANAIRDRLHKTKLKVIGFAGEAEM